MKAIIIAAGYGSRLDNHTKEIPKVLIDINGKSILDRQSELLEDNGIKKIIVVIGPNKTKFRNQKLQYVEDSFFQEHEQLGSLMEARNYFDEELLILFSDILFDQKVLFKILNSDCDIGISLDLDWKKGYDGRTEHPMSEADLALVENNKIVKIQKNLISNFNSKIGEFIGIIKLSSVGAKNFVKHFENLENSHEGKFHNADSLNKAYLTDMIQDLIQNGEAITPIFVDGKWCEIDTPQDLERAKCMFD